MSARRLCHGNSELVRSVIQAKIVASDALDESVRMNLPESLRKKIQKAKKCADRTYSRLKACMPNDAIDELLEMEEMRRSQTHTGFKSAAPSISELGPIFDVVRSASWKLILTKPTGWQIAHDLGNYVDDLARIRHHVYGVSKSIDLLTT